MGKAGNMHVLSDMKRPVFYVETSIITQNKLFSFGKGKAVNMYFLT